MLRFFLVYVKTLLRLLLTFIVYNYNLKYRHNNFKSKSKNPKRKIEKMKVEGHDEKNFWNLLFKVYLFATSPLY